MRFFRDSTFISLLSVVACLNVNAVPYEINYGKVDTSGWNCYLCEFNEAGYRNIDMKVSLLRSTEGQARFGRETGIDDEGTYQVLDMSIQDSRMSGWESKVSLLRLGLDNEEASLTFGIPRKFGFTLDRRGRPHNVDKGTQTPFTLSRNHLSLDDEWVGGYSTSQFATLERLSQPIYLRTDRSSTKLQSWVLLGANLRLETELLRERKQGFERTFRDGFYQATALPKPIDRKIGAMGSSLYYEGRHVILSLRNSSMHFDNRHSVLNWQSPYNPNSFIRTTAYEPDYQYQSTDVTASFVLSARTRINVSAVESDVHQEDADSHPYTNNVSLQVKPTGMELGSFGMENKHRAISIVQRIVPRIRVLLLHDRSNRIDRRQSNLFRQIIGDFIELNDHESIGYSLTKVNSKVGIRYDPNERFHLSIGLQRESRERSFQEIDSTKSNKAWLQLSTMVGSGWRLESKLESAHRKAGEFQLNSLNHPLTRRFHVASRKQEALHFGLRYQQNEFPLESSFSYKTVKGRYPESILGLQGENIQMISGQISYDFSDTRSLDFAYVRQGSTDNIRGSDWSREGDWQYFGEDDVETSNLSFVDQKFLGWPLNLNASIFVSEGSGNLAVQSTTGKSTFPSLISDEYSARVEMSWNTKEAMLVTIVYGWTKYRSRDWARDDVERRSVNNVLSMGGRSNRYVNQLTAISFRLQY